MPKKRRQAHIPQQATRKRRVARRPEFAPAPESQERTDLEGKPIFADDVVVPTPAYDATGPIETRAAWISNGQGQTQPGRRTAQLRRGATPATGARVTAGQLPTFPQGYLAEELRRIALISGSLFALIIVLALVLR